MYYNSNILKIGSHMMIQKGTADVFITMRRCVSATWVWMATRMCCTPHSYIYSFLFLAIAEKRFWR